MPILPRSSCRQAVAHSRTLAGKLHSVLKEENDMSRLGDEIRQRIGARESKELFPGYVEALESIEKPELSTFVTKLSKLCNGAAEGERYFLDNPARSSAFEKVLGVERGWLAAQQRVRVLVLDPALTQDAITFLKERETHAAGAFACRETSLEGLAAPVPRPAVLAKIREVAERESGALVVTANDKDALYFEGAKITWTLLERRPRGFVLQSDPELVPLPAPAAPPLFDREGEPLMPHAEFEILARKEKDAIHSWNGYSYGRSGDQHDQGASDCLFQHQDSHNNSAQDLNELARSILDADSAGREASFPVTQVLPWLLSRRGLTLRVVRDADGRRGTSTLWILKTGMNESMAARVGQALEGADCTLVWLHGREIVGVGPQIEQIAELLAPHHVLHQPAAMIRWREALSTWNPWRTGDRGGLPETERWKSLKLDVSRDLGLWIESTVVEWRRRVATRCAWPQTPVRLATPEEATAAQDALATLAARRWYFDSRAVVWPLRLDAASRASVAILPGHGEREGLHVIANLGGGHLLRILAVRFADEAPAEIVKCGGDYEMDGGDVHLWFEQISDSFLEGSGPPSKRRR
ncbi:MAG: hypothetical protein ABJE95_25385 [Byssovorax sp.]